jgi:WD40 repeat protein
MLAIMTPNSACGVCGTPLSAGFCPRCLLDVGVSPEPDELPTSVDPLMPPPRLGDYELLEEIGRGGMGIVYRARQVSLDRIVAIKLLPFGGLAGKQSALRFRAEAVAAGSLRHPNIVAIHEVGLHDERHFIAMDFVPGQSLARVLRDGPLAPRRAASLVREVALAVQHAHEHGIIHRDIKPSNILVDSVDGQPRVTDFGLAKNLRSDTELTLSGQTLGSPNYIPPEQIRGSKRREALAFESQGGNPCKCESEAQPSCSSAKTSFATDVYALGATLYHTLTGRPPFMGQDIAAVLHQTLQDEPLPPRRLNPSIPVDLETICLKCLEKEPSQRYATAKELADELWRFVRDEPIQARPVTRAERAWRWCRRNPVAAGLALATLLLLVTVAIGAPIAAFRINAQRRQAELRGYSSDMNVVYQVWEEGNLNRAQALLQSHSPKPGEPDLRGIEWRLLWKLCQDQSVATVTNFHDRVRSLAITPDGRTLFVGSGGAVNLLDLVDYRQQGELRDDQAPPSLVAICSALPYLVATAGAKGSRVCLWNLLSRKVMAVLDGAGSQINALTFSPNGELLALASETGTIEVWDVMGRTNVWRHEPKHPSRTLAFSRDGRTLVSGGSQHGGNALFWDARTGAKLPGIPPAHGGWLSCAVFSPDGLTLATSGVDGTIILWDFAAHRRLQTFNVPANTLAFSPDGHRFAAGGNDNLVRLWDLATPEKPPLIWRGHRVDVTALAFAPNGSGLLSGSADGVVKVWSLDAQMDGDLLMKADHWVTTLAISPDGKRLAAADYHENRAALFDLLSRRWMTNLGGHSAAIQGVAFSADSKWLATGSEDQTVRLWSMTSLQLKRVFTNDFQSTLPAFSPDNRVLAVAGWIPTALKTTNTLAFWDLNSGAKLDQLEAAGPWASAVAFSHNGKFVAVGYFDGSVKIWSWRNQRLVTEFKNSIGTPVWSLAFSEDDKLLASSPDPTILDLRKRQVSHLEGYPCATLAFSHDKKSLVCVRDGGLVFWNLSTRSVALRFLCHAGAASGLAITPDETLLATSAADGTVRLWAAPSLRQIKQSENGR